MNVIFLTDFIFFHFGAMLLFMILFTFCLCSLIFGVICIFTPKYTIAVLVDSCGLPTMLKIAFWFLTWIIFFNLIYILLIFSIGPNASIAKEILSHNPHFGAPCCFIFVPFFLVCSFRGTSHIHGYSITQLVRAGFYIQTYCCGFVAPVDFLGGFHFLNHFSIL